MTVESCIVKVLSEPNEDGETDDIGCLLQILADSDDFDVIRHQLVSQSIANSI